MMHREPWDQVVADAAPGDHIVQLYQDQEFLSRAVCRYARAGLVNGEGVMLFPTLTHWNAFRPRLEAEGVDVDAAQERGQLTVVDADESCPASCGTPCRIRLHSAALSGTSSDRRAPEGATKRCVRGEKWSISCGSAGTSPPA